MLDDFNSDRDADPANGDNPIFNFRSLNGKIGLSAFVASAGLALLVTWVLGLGLFWKLVAAGVVGLLVVCLLEHVPAACDHFLCFEDRLMVCRSQQWEQYDFEALESFSVTLADMYLNGAYVHTRGSYEFHFVNPNGTREILNQELHFRSASDKGRSEEAMRGRCSEVVAARMLEELHRNGQVAWVSGATILPGGIEVIPRSSHIPRQYRYSEINGWEVKDGRFFLWVGDETIVDCDAGTRDFFPGLSLVQWLAQGQQDVDTIDGSEVVSRESGVIAPPAAV